MFDKFVWGNVGAFRPRL